MNLLLKDNRIISSRALESGDAKKLYDYLNTLSNDSRQRFGPHSFDETTVNIICYHPYKDIHRYIAIEPHEEKIIAYMLFKKGMIEGDRQRFAQRNQYFDPLTTITFAPSVADDWQSSGVGSCMYGMIEKKLKSAGIKQVVLWGGVQATNIKAINFYKKHNYQVTGSFWHDGKDNHDMIKWLDAGNP
jgi:GNAT superfamily N-acetyltransferase